MLHFGMIPSFSLHNVFEADGVSFLGEVARAGNKHIAKTIAREVSSPKKRAFLLELKGLPLV
ncbi:hypothetical protein EUTSA_v10026909mg [Eutrema salsugineum]|uniref:Uncharacterized protein n=1 Tax=Eutrema salsugineum TaxID=72664 RepID=V4M0H9_EUTSA|nr:hypothetical protein EUTSA_v10026909mg [Eutrema salsugineum]